MTSSGDRESNTKDFLMQMLEVEQQIQQAISGISNQEAIFEDISQEIQSSLGFDLTSIWLIDPENNIIARKYENNISTQKLTFNFSSKYYLEINSHIQDILVDVVQNHRTEIICGWDKRFDKWVYEEYKHEELTRIFTPILLVQDKNGNIIEDWFKHYKWKFTSEEKTGDGYRAVIDMFLITQNNQNLGNIRVIGAVISGYAKRNKQITLKQAEDLIKLVAQHALRIRRTQLSYILEVITENAYRILQADIAALDFMYEPNHQDYVYQVGKGKINENYWENFTYSKQALRQKALKDRKTIFTPNIYQNHPNNLAKIFEKKSQATVACPLLIDNKEGLLYLEFNDKYGFTEDEVSLLNIFGYRANSAILHAISEAKNNLKNSQLVNLHLFTQSLINETEKEFLIRRITWSIGNIMGADIVIFYEYIQPENKVIIPPEITGRLIKDKSKYTELYQNDNSLMLINNTTNIYESSLNISKFFKNSDFVKKEEIKSIASILLKIREEVVGVMFIAYRRIYNFSENEQKQIETLASSAAYAIKNQRWLNSWLQTLSDIDRKLITTLEQEKLLNLIVQRAVEKTKADFGSIALLQPNNWELETKALYPKNSKKEEIGMRKKVEHGITGQVAKNRRAELVNDVRQDPNYRELFPNVRSELCVPLLDKEDNLIGVLNVESSKVNAFEARDLRLLQEVANLAVIGIRNAKKQEQLAKAEVMAALGDIAGPLVHRTNNNVGAIRVLAQDICEEADDNIKSFATEILSNAEEILEYSQRMRSWMKDQPQIISLRDIIQEALAKVQIPDNIEQDINIDLDLSQVYAGKQQLINVFDNLIQNAINAMPNGGKLYIQGSHLETDAGNKIKVVICDTGVGIATKNLQKIFEPGYSTKDTNKNMGFGLWWTKFYIERLEGNVEVESEVGKGSQFTLILPVHKPLA
ncbi:GAF domain-containing protein [Mastigocoleus testarum]|uniref:histidine kinase n=1 Tax=Mastigocoleus testarum BC008 TaxID=371196 RepID=A0A0V7ZNS9_9CYAN|nr:GAF domain-containing protein [Mastigocoleus testarum]KST65524.1 hypothetical protein BC008_42120 [Mastigocoleus testarum BC008]KST66088.1 hypothetical protein BC008_24235 [Mastigocoleus testarum BC008]